MRIVRREPIASMLIESLRDIGYNLETALADVIDNSISAGAGNVDLHAMVEDGCPVIAIVDDGHGMTEDELLDAMRPGSKNPLESRSSSDLGRFGLGLKTASFSQCRRLTVITRRNGETSAAIWDLDHVAKVNQWDLLLPDDPETLQWAGKLGSSGTVVLWETLDRFTPDAKTGDMWTHFAESLSTAEHHLSLVFHRFLSGSSRRKKLAITLNGRKLDPFDPFHSGHTATQSSPVETIPFGGHRIRLQAFTLPHHQKVTTKEWEHFGGPEGYVRNQGFYVYRADRLIIHGTWFGLARQREITKLARVAIDMPTALDDKWQIDVKKSTARPPQAVMTRLRQLVEDIGASSSRVYTSRTPLTQKVRFPVWNRIQDKNEILYRLNEDHPVIRDFLAELSPAQQAGLQRVLELAGAALPVDALFADLGTNPYAVTTARMGDDTLRHSLRKMARDLRAANLTDDNIRDILRRTEPFKTNWERSSRLLDEEIDD
jgi:hypothetical protein